MQIYNSSEIVITDTDGKGYVVSPLSFSDRERFRSLLNELLDIVKESEDKTIEFIELYDRDLRVNTICNIIFDLHNMNINKLSSDMLFSMLFPTNGQDMGILAQLNALKAKNVGRDSPSEVKDSYHKLLAQIYELTGSIQESVELFKTVPAATLLSTMEALAEIRRETDPEAKKEDLKQKAMDRIKEMQSQMNLPPE